MIPEAHRDILAAFGLPPQVSALQLCAEAPVYRVRTAQGDRIVKRTRAPIEAGVAIGRWTRSLVEGGIASVAPVEEIAPNPRAFGAEIWVVYPFIDGQEYRGERPQLGAAGALLGRIHGAGLEADFGLEVRERVVAVAPEEITGSAAAALEHLERARPGKAGRLEEAVCERAARYFDEALPRALEARLPLSNCSWDYKAGNLVFETPTRPVLIDPDSGGRIPKAYDLAIAAFLFPNSAPEAPRRTLTRREWLVFLEAYQRECPLDEAEVRCWEDLLLCAWMDEALWLLGDNARGWDDPVERTWLWSLMTVDLATYRLA